MRVIQRVTLLGKGLLGSAVVDKLVEAGFTVTVLSRNPDLLTGLPDGVKAIKADYSSVESLTSALQGQDAVVNTVASAQIPNQRPAIDAAVAAGVRRYIPADFGALSTDPEAHSVPVHRQMVEIQEYLKDKAGNGELEWTVFATGPFLEYVLSAPLALDWSNKKAELYDDGEYAFSTASVSSIAQAVAGALKKADETKNRVVFVHDIITTQARLLEIAKRHTPKDVEWTVTSVDSKARLRSLQSDEDGIDASTLLNQLRTAILGGNFASEYKHVDNELFGIRLLTNEELEAKVEAHLKQIA